MLIYNLNLEHPADYKGHSLSASDVVALQQNGKTSSHFVDSVGFQEVSDFLQVRQPEQQRKENQDKVSYYVISDLAT